MDERAERGQQAMAAVDGAAARSIREGKKLTQLYVATVVGVTTDTISRWENNRYPNIKKENAEKLAEALGVQLEEILRREEPEQEPAPPAPQPRSPLRWVIPAVVLLAAAAAAFLLLQEPQVKGVRTVPANAAPGELIPVRITIERPGETGGVIVKEMLPPGWVIEKANPSSAGGEKGGELKWLLPAGSGKASIFYTVRVAPGASGAAAYSGSISFDSAGATRTAAISGGKATRIGPYHWSDANGDFRVDDGEVMPAYYLSEEMKGLGLDWETVEAIWSGKGYRWDAAGRRYEVLR